MQVVYTYEQFPSRSTKSLFLAGPSPHETSSAIWQDDALSVLHEQGYDGCVFVPISRNGSSKKDYKVQSDWEQDAMDRSDVIVFWVPRDLASQPGFTTNVEFGQRIAGGNIVLGYPSEAPNMRYLEYLAQRNGAKTYHTLPETIRAALHMIDTKSSKKRTPDVRSAKSAAKKLTDEEFFCINNTGTYKQYHTMRSRFEKDECGFCHRNEVLSHVLFENEHWFVLENAFKNGRPCRVMLVVVSKSHWRKLSDITREAWTTLVEVVAYSEKRFDLPGGMFFMRFGDMQLNSGTVPHLHINLWVPDQTGPISATIFKGEEERERNAKRAAEFAKWYEAGDTPETHN